MAQTIHVLFKFIFVIKLVFSSLTELFVDNLQLENVVIIIDEHWHGTAVDQDIFAVLFG